MSGHEQPHEKNGKKQRNISLFPHSPAEAAEAQSQSNKHRNTLRERIQDGNH